MTDLNKAPEMIWAFHAPEVEDDNPGCAIIAGESAMHGAQQYIRHDMHVAELAAAKSDTSLDARQFAEAVKLIANQADATGQMANVGGCETAGLIVSVIAANPELAADFLANPVGTMIDNQRMTWGCGALTWHAQNGEIVTPKRLRESQGELAQ